MPGILACWMGQQIVRYPGPGLNLPSQLFFSSRRSPLVGLLRKILFRALHSRRNSPDTTAPILSIQLLSIFSGRKTWGTWNMQNYSGSHELDRALPWINRLLSLGHLYSKSNSLRAALYHLEIWWSNALDLDLGRRRWIILQNRRKPMGGRRRNSNGTSPLASLGACTFWDLRKSPAQGTESRGSPNWHLSLPRWAPLSCYIDLSTVSLWI